MPPTLTRRPTACFFSKPSTGPCSPRPASSSTCGNFTRVRNSALRATSPRRWPPAQLMTHASPDPCSRRPRGARAAQGRETPLRRQPLRGHCRPGGRRGRGGGVLGLAGRRCANAHGAWAGVGARVVALCAASCGAARPSRRLTAPRPPVPRRCGSWRPRYRRWATCCRRPCSGRGR